MVKEGKTVAKPVIIQPDPAFVRRVQAIMLGLLLLLGLTGYGLDGYLRNLAASPEAVDRERLLSVSTLAFWIILLTGTLMAGWMLWLARAILRAGRFPLEGQRVLRPTPLRTGPPARHMAWGLAVGGTVLLLLMPAMFWIYLEFLRLLSPA